MIKNKPIKILTIASTVALQSCVNVPIKETFNSDDPCNNNKRNLFSVLGAVTGAVVANKTSDDKHKTTHTILGGLAGGAIGGLIGSELDKRACEIHKIAQKNGLHIETTRIKSTEKVRSQNTSNTPDQYQAQPVDVGYSIAVVNQKDKPQFLSGSSQIEPSAKQHFREIAQQYTAKHVIASDNITDPKQAAAIKKTMSNKRILLIGHTDDTGNSKANVRLSEQRARSVAQIFKQAGIRESQIYYQGAGETMPIADNATQAGRQKNRRVEIVDLSDQAKFDLYLKNKRPKTAFYRPVNKNAAITKKAMATTAEQKPNREKNSRAQQQRATNIEFFDFKGKPYSSQLASVSSHYFKPVERKFTLINEAVASDIEHLQTCDIDRPRDTGLVKSLKNNTAYYPSDFFNGLDGNLWYQKVAGNLVVIKDLSVLQSGALPSNKPLVTMYKNYSKKNRNKKPEVTLRADVNAYSTQDGLVYRIFMNNTKGVDCMDLLFSDNSVNVQAKDGRIIYNYDGLHVAKYKPKRKY